MVSGFVLSLSAIWLLGGFGLLAPERDQLIWSTLAGSLCFFSDWFGRRSVCPFAMAPLGGSDLGSGCNLEPRGSHWSH
jgi:hypothetical protein